MNGYVKLFDSIFMSTVWQEDNPTRIVWITLLGKKDRDGIVEGSIPGLAHLARVTIPEAEAAISKFLAPDPHSRTSDYEGRRIEAIDGGWRVLNHEKYRDLLSREDKLERDRVRQQRHRERTCHTESVTERDTRDMSQMSRHPDADPHPDTDPVRTNPPSFPNKNQEPEDPSFEGSEWALKTCKAYPLWKDPDALTIAPGIGDLYMQVIEREAPARGGKQAAAEWLLARVVQFAKQRKEAGTEDRYIPFLKNWLTDGSYASVQIPVVRQQKPEITQEEAYELVRKHNEGLEKKKAERDAAIAAARKRRQRGAQ